MKVQELEEMELPHLQVWEEEPSLEVAVVLVVFMCQVVLVLLVVLQDLLEMVLQVVIVYLMMSP